MREYQEDIVQVKTEELQHIKNLIDKMIFRQNQENNKAELMNIDEVAHYTRYSKSAIYKFVQGESIPFIKKGRKLLFKRKKIDEWIISH